MSRNEPSKPKLDLTFYPAYCYSASPTWSKWVKLTCWDVHHALRPHQQQGKAYTSGGSTSSQTLFYLNHPIQYVQLVGIVVAIEDYYESHFLLTLDDSSGATIDVVVRKPKPKSKPNPNAPNTASTATTTNTLPDPLDEETQQTLSLLSTLSTLTLSTPILAKGTLSTFRSVRQLSLLRLSILPSTTAELTHIASRTAFLASTLGKPWILSPTRQRKLREAAESDRVRVSGRQKKERERNAEQRAWEERRGERLREVWEWEEGQRGEEAEEARRDGVVVMEERRKRLEAAQVKDGHGAARLPAIEVAVEGDREQDRDVQLKGEGKGKGSG